MNQRIPNEVIIPALVAMSGEEKKADEKKPEDKNGPVCCGCLVVIALLSLGSYIFGLIF